MPFNIDEYAYCFQTSPNKAYFWHGRTTKDGVIYEEYDNAMRIAKMNGGKTLEMCMLEHREELKKTGVIFKENPETDAVMISYSGTEMENQQFWDDCSKCFAEQARGEVHVIEGADIRPDGTAEQEYKGSMWARIEKPILTAENNDKVQSIISHDAVHGKTQGVIFERDIKIKKELSQQLERGDLNEKSAKPDRTKPNRERPDRNQKIRKTRKM